MVRYISYGLGNYDEERFDKIQNLIYNNKPKGGLWSSPENSKHSWYDWCKDNDFRVLHNDIKGKFLFSLKNDSKIYKIDSFQDLKNCPAIIDYRLGGITRRQIDFEKMVDLGYDAIWLTDEGEWSTRFPNLYNLSNRIDVDIDFTLYGWDCETMLVLNKEAIVDVENFPSEKALEPYI